MIRTNFGSTVRNSIWVYYSANTIGPRNTSLSPFIPNPKYETSISNSDIPPSEKPNAWKNSSKRPTWLTNPERDLGYHWRHKLGEISNKAPRRFKLTVGKEYMLFKHCVQVDIMFLKCIPVLQIIYEASYFCAATFLRSQSTVPFWKSKQSMWHFVYFREPDFISVDQGTNNISK